MEGRRGRLLAHPPLQPRQAAVLSARWGWAAAAGLAVFGTVAANLPHALAGVFYDDGIYLALGRSLAEGHGYRLLYLPGAPAAVHYPPLYPFFLAALWKIGPAFPAGVTLMRVANAVLMGLFAFVVSASLGERVTGRSWLGALLIAATATAIPLVATAAVLFAEPLFLVLAALACWGADAARDAEGRRLYVLAALAGLLAGLAALTRSIGVAAVAGVVLALVRKPRAAAAAALISMALLLPWGLWVAAHRAETDPVLAANYGTYADLVRQSGWGWLRVSSIGTLVRPLAALVLPPMPSWLWIAAAAWVTIVLAVGVAALVRKAPATGWTLAAYLLVVAFWPYGPDRFLWAVVPWMGLAFVAAMRAIHSRVVPVGSRRVGMRAFALVTGALVVSGFTFNGARGYAHGAATSEQRAISATFEAVLPWILEATDTSDVIAGEDEALLWLYTGRRAVPSYLWRARGRSAESLGADSLKSYFDRSGVTHVILTGPGSDAAPTIDAMLARFPGYLNPVQVWPGPMIAFRVARGP
ncbi:MAG: hypothetical protein AABY85_12045 [Gemmatimonadota bacterium]